MDTQHWVSSLWAFLNGAHAILDLENQWVPKIIRVHDMMIMDFALQLNFMASQLHRLNTCRLYLQVLTISDITTADGRHILPTIMEGFRDETRISILLWPTSMQPKNWSAWNLFI